MSTGEDPAPTPRPGRPPQRVRVTSPRATLLSPPTTRPVTRDIDEHTGVGEVYMRSLLRSQRRLAGTVLTVVVLCLGALPTLFTAFPVITRFRVATVPLPWLILGCVVYPLLVGASWWHIRAAERIERDFTELAGAPPTDGPDGGRPRP